jgi:imidazoleglycerol-phosphate dehydratase
MRKAKIERKTKETKINVYLNLDRSDGLKVEVKRGFIKHMLETFAFHAGFVLKIKAE